MAGGGGILGLVAAAVIAAPALGQPAAAPQPRRIDAGTEDVNPMRVDPREPRVDLRRPTGFDGVYQFNRVDAFGTGETLFMRTSGGLTAVFPRSVYSRGRNGLIPQIPAGTVFYMGELPESVTGAGRRTPGPASETQVDLTADLRAEETRAVAGAETAAARSVSIWSDESFRQRRLGQLIGRLGE